MSEFTDQLKASADMGRLIGDYVTLRPGGNGFVGLCPFHSEKTPSFHVHQARQFYYCFGCHAHGDIYRFLMDLKHVSFPEAVEMVAERMGVEVPRAAADTDPRRRELLRVHELAAGFYEGMLAGGEGAAARAYLQSRELGAEACAGFGLGYAPESGRALTRFLEQRKCSVEMALASGLCQPRRESRLREGGEAAPGTATAAGFADLYDRFRDRLMFPIGDERGRVIAFGGRTLSQQANTPKYLNSPESPLYIKSRVLYNFARARTAIRELGYAILVEGYFDCLRVFAAGFQNVVASCGTALASPQVQLLGRCGGQVLVNFDPDSAGAAAAERSIALLLEEGLQMRVVVLGDGLDPDLFVRQRGKAAYAEALKSARSFFDYLAERARSQFDLRRGEGKLGAVNHLLPYLSHVRDPILRQSLAENLAAQLGIEQPVISRQLLQAARQRQVELPASAEAVPELLPAERVVLRAWMDWEAQRPQLASLIEQEGLLAGLSSEPLMRQLLEGERQGRSLAQVQEGLPAGDYRLVAQLSLNSEPLALPDLEAAVRALQEHQWRGVARRLQGEIAAAAARGDKAGVENLAREKAILDSRLRSSEGPSKAESRPISAGGGAGL